MAFTKKMEHQPQAEPFDIKIVANITECLKKTPNEQTLLLISNMHFYWL